MTAPPATDHGVGTGNVALLLADAAAERPAAPALYGADGRLEWTVAELTGLTAAMAGRLVERGLEPGDRVIVLVRDPLAALPAILAIVWAGGAVVLPPRTRGLRSLVRAAAEVRPRMVIADRLMSAACMPFARLRRCSVPVASLASGPRVAPVARAAGDPALLSWTTGTTGAPHLVVRSHGVLDSQHRALAAVRPVLSGDVDLVGLPALALHDLAVGAACVFPPRSRAPGRSPGGSALRRLVEQARVTTAAGFPALFEVLVAGARPAELSRLRAIHVGGAPVTPDLLSRLAAAAPNADIVVTYGMTEAEPISTIGAGRYRALLAAAPAGRGLPVGRPLPGLELRIDAAAGHNRSGRILVRGARVARDATHAEDDGWLDTGDAGRVDQDGTLWLLGRAVNAAPGPVWPLEIEQPAEQLPGVRRAALLSAVPVGGAGGATLVLEPADCHASARPLLDAAGQLVRRCGWQVDRVRVIARLPDDRRSGTKIDYGRLRAMLGDGGGRPRAVFARRSRGS